MEENTKSQKSVSGVIEKLDSGMNTIKVRVERQTKHDRYEKIIRFHKSFLVEVPEAKKADLKVGDNVTITPIRPISKNKKWKLELK